MGCPRLRIDYVDATTDVIMDNLDHNALMQEIIKRPAAIDGLLTLFMRKIELLYSSNFKLSKKERLLPVYNQIFSEKCNCDRICDLCMIE